MKRRITLRKNNSFGKNDAELQYILKKHKEYEETARSSGSIMVDASQPLSSVVKIILDCIE